MNRSANFVIVVSIIAALTAALPALAQDKPILAVMDIEDKTGKHRSRDLDSATDYLRALLVRSGHFSVVDKGRQEAGKRKIVKELKRETHRECYDKKCRVALGQALSADSLLTCFVGAIGTICTMSCELVPLEREVAEKAGVVDFPCGDAGLVSAIKTVTNQLGSAPAITKTPVSAIVGEHNDRVSAEEPKSVSKPSQDLHGTTAVVTFESSPSNAEIFVDGKRACNSPCTIDITLGPRRVVMKKPRYGDGERFIVVKKNMPPIVLELTPDFGWLTVASKPKGLPVHVDGKEVGTTTLFRHQVSTGHHEVLVSDARYYDQGKQVQIDRGESEIIKVELQAREGGLAVSARDELGNDLAAQVWLDDTWLGMTPLAKQVLIGQHKLKVVHGGRQVEQDVEVKEKQVEDIAVEVKGEAGKSGSTSGPGNRADTKSGLTWQVTPTGGTMNWSKAKAHCAGLELDGHTDWRLPTIGQLRSLIRGCQGTADGGSCNINEGLCLKNSCRGNSCSGCSNRSGPADGCYWPDEMQGTCGWYWSSSPVEDNGNYAWHVNFNLGSVPSSFVANGKHVRCVRDAP